MNDSFDVTPSTIPARAALFAIFLIVTFVLFFVVGWSVIFLPIWLGLVLGGAIWLLFDLVRWLRSDKNTRPKMKFPRKTATALLLVIMAVGYFGYLIARDMGVP